MNTTGTAPFCSSRSLATGEVAILNGATREQANAVSRELGDSEASYLCYRASEFGDPARPGRRLGAPAGLHLEQ